MTLKKLFSCVVFENIFSHETHKYYDLDEGNIF